MNASSTFAATDGDGYELVMGRWSARLAVPFLDFAGTLDGERVLDVGCGTGHLAQAVVERSMPREVRAIDLAPAYIDYAKSRNRDPRVLFELGDACAVNFADHTFDRVLSMLVLHFVPQAARAISEMRRVAKPGGVVAACVWDVRGGFVANRIFFDTAAALDPKANERRARNYTRPLTKPGELAWAWREAGLQDSSRPRSASGWSSTPSQTTGRRMTAGRAPLRSTSQPSAKRSERGSSRRYGRRSWTESPTVPVRTPPWPGQ